MKPVVKSFLIWLRSRMFTLYLVTFLLSLLCVNYSVVTNNLLALKLNHIKPISLNILLELEGNIPYPKRALQEYVNYYKTLTRILTDKAAPYSTLGFLLYHQGKLDEATKMFAKGFANNRTFPTFGFNLGYMYHLKKEYKQSNAVLLKTITNTPQGATAYIEYSFTYKQIIIANLQKKQKIMDVLFTRISDSHILIAENYLALKDYKSLLSFSEQSLNAAIPAKELFYYYAGVAAFFLKDFKTALTYFEHYHNQNITDPNIVYYHALTYKALNQEPKAKELLKESLLLKSNERSFIDTIIKNLKPHAF